MNENDNSRTAEGGQTASQVTNGFTYNDNQCADNSNAYLRPYTNTLTGSATDPIITAWVD
jgi:hypothetical protein